MSNSHAKGAHSSITRYQDFLPLVGNSKVASLAAQVEAVYGPVNCPGVEALALSGILNLEPQDSCEVFRSLVNPGHPIRQALLWYLANCS